MLKWRHYDGALGPCLAIPFVDMAGRRTPYVRLKPDRPRKDREGKTIKYESPQGVGNRAYFPPVTVSQLIWPSKAMIITEGEKKAAKADQEGYCCIGLVGVYGWQKKRELMNGSPYGARRLINDLECVQWIGRDVFICYDSDAATNQNVVAAERHLAEALKCRGAKVRIVRLPTSAYGKKVGLDDALVLCGTGYVNGLLRSAAIA